MSRRLLLKNTEIPIPSVITKYGLDVTSSRAATHPVELGQWRPRSRHKLPGKVPVQYPIKYPDLRRDRKHLIKLFRSDRIFENDQIVFLKSNKYFFPTPKYRKTSDAMLYMPPIEALYKRGIFLAPN
jgi:hypothetical protein